MSSINNHQAVGYCDIPKKRSSCGIEIVADFQTVGLGRGGQNTTIPIIFIFMIPWPKMLHIRISPVEKTVNNTGQQSKLS